MKSNKPLAVLEQPLSFHAYDDDIINEDQKGEELRSGDASRPSSKNLYLSSTPTDMSSDNELRTQKLHG